MADNLNTVYLSTPGVGTVNQTSAASTSFSDVSVVNNVIASGISAATGQFSSTLSVAGATKAAHVACAGVTSSSGITVTATIPFSILTRVNENDLSIGQLVLVQRASGLSLIYSSGASIYELCESVVSAAQPTT